MRALQSYIIYFVHRNAKCYVSNNLAITVLLQDEEEEIKLEINVLKKVCYMKDLCFAVYVKFVGTFVYVKDCIISTEATSIIDVLLL